MRSNQCCSYYRVGKTHSSRRSILICAQMQKEVMEEAPAVLSNTTNTADSKLEALVLIRKMLVVAVFVASTNSVLVMRISTSAMSYISI
ncbi:hypothetical protein ARMGADRAFT_774510 [Armillaria gallica]|uniref:Uncharacterized protein n=1 Tax=Armillaria gallica TaxID=47427 RepID=A0A2H3D0A3_ARMGA|nr:hypothetical protein ARMGADRAFT_774510 [Armillaria gallica]